MLIVDRFIDDVNNNFSFRDIIPEVLLTLYYRLFMRRGITGEYTTPKGYTVCDELLC